MTKQTNAQANDEFMQGMRAKGFDTIFVSELPYPKSTSRCSLILSTQDNIIYIRDEVVA